MHRTIWGLAVGAALGCLATSACSSTDTKVGSFTGPTTSDPCTKVGETTPAADGCNTCTCGSNGRWLCTEVACETRCPPGATKPAGDGCNQCSCMEDGRWGCTQMACEACSPGATKPAGDGCNICNCHDDGTWACTFAACNCEPSTVWLAEDGCNTCSCGADGTPQGCTFKACGTCPPARQTTEACPPVVVWARDPNQGTCCEYGDPCRAPAGWQQFNTGLECAGFP